MDPAGGSSGHGLARLWKSPGMTGSKASAHTDLERDGEQPRLGSAPLTSNALRDPRRRGCGGTFVLLPRLFGPSTGWSVKVRGWLSFIRISYVRTVGASLFGLAAATAITLNTSNQPHLATTYVLWYTLAAAGLVIVIVTTVVIDRKTRASPQLIQSQYRQDHFSYLVPIADQLQEAVAFLPEQVLTDCWMLCRRVPRL